VEGYFEGSMLESNKDVPAVFMTIASKIDPATDNSICAGEYDVRSMNNGTTRTFNVK
jgi:hypothetical protein